MLAIGLFAAANCQAQSAPTNGLVAYYPFNGNANDAAGANNGTVVGATLATNRFGQPNSAYSFNGSNAYISFASVPLNQIDNWTISAWVQPSTLPQLGNAICLGFDDGNTANGVAFGISCVNGYIYDAPGTNFTATFGGVDWIASGYSFDTTNAWCHLVMTRSAGVTSFYVNGVQTANTALAIPRIPTAFTIGAANLSDGTRSFSGLIDDVRIYNQALSSNQVQQLYSTESNAPLPEGLVAYYPFSGNANDAVGTNNGTVVGATLAANRFGQPNSCYSFNGSNAYINFASVPLNQIDNWTISVWVQPSKLPQLGNVVSLGYDDGTAYLANGVSFGISRFDGYVYDAPGTNFSATFGGVDWIASGYSFASTTAWYHLVMTRGAGVTSFYVNGVQTTNTSLDIPVMPTAFRVGAANVPNGRRSFSGLIDDVRIYNQTLSSNQVQQLYTVESTPSVPSFVTNGLVAYYPFSGNVTNDATGRGHNGTNYGAQLTTDRFGNPNSAIVLDGKSSCVGIPYSPDFDFPTDGQFSLTAWFNLAGPGSGVSGTGSILVKCPRQGSYDYYGIWNYGMVSYYNGESDFWAGLHNEIAVITPTPVQLNAWQQGIMTYSNGNWRLYLNGVLVSQSQAPCAITSSTGGLAIGRKGDVLVDYFNGSIDDVRIYNRALSDSEIQQLYTYESPTPAAPSITTQPQSLTVNAHDNAQFNVVASSLTPFSYQWAFNGTNIPGANSDSLIITNVVQTNIGIYTVTVTNACGSATSSNAVLSMKPFIQTPFGGTVATWGKDASLSVQAWGTGPLTYQWFKDGVAVLNATNSTLDIPSVQFTNAGLYTVVITNPFGSVTNTAAQVAINPAGVSLGMYPGVIVSGVVGYTYTIQSTTNLGDTNSWVNAATITLMQPEQLWVDVKNNAASPTNKHRIYRVVVGQ